MIEWTKNLTKIFRAWKFVKFLNREFMMSWFLDLITLSIGIVVRVATSNLLLRLLETDLSGLKTRYFCARKEMFELYFYSMK